MAFIENYSLLETIIVISERFEQNFIINISTVTIDISIEEFKPISCYFVVGF